MRFIMANLLEKTRKIAIHLEMTDGTVAVRDAL